MKKIIITLIASTLLVSLLGISTLTSSASFGSGVSAVANSVKLIKTGLLGQKLCFNDADFKSALCLSDF